MLLVKIKVNNSSLYEKTYQLHPKHIKKLTRFLAFRTFFQYFGICQRFFSICMLVLARVNSCQFTQLSIPFNSYKIRHNPQAEITLHKKGFTSR